MSFSSILNTIDRYIKIAPWLQFVGYMLAFGGLVTKHPTLTYVGLGVSMAGWLYNKIYP
jgi:hypothetical protein